ncbi:MAG: hypothetical protein AAFY42_08620 [Pseudomonadota bacterium]
MNMPSAQTYLDACENASFAASCIGKFASQLLVRSPIPQLTAAWAEGNKKHKKDGALAAPTPEAVRELCSAPRWRRTVRLDLGCHFGMAVIPASRLG